MCCNKYYTHDTLHKASNNRKIPYFNLPRTSRLKTALTPSLPQPVKLPAEKCTHMSAKQDILRSGNKSTFNSVRFDENPFKKKKTWLQDFTFRTFICHFQVASWQ